MGRSEVSYYEWECDRCCEIESGRYEYRLPIWWSGDRDYSYCQNCTEEMEEEDRARQEAGDEWIVWMQHNGLL